MQPSNRVRCGAYGSDWHFATLLKLPYNGRYWEERTFGQPGSTSRIYEYTLI